MLFNKQTLFSIFLLAHMIIPATVSCCLLHFFLFLKGFITDQAGLEHTVVEAGIELVSSCINFPSTGVLGVHQHCTVTLEQCMQYLTGGRRLKSCL